MTLTDEQRAQLRHQLIMDDNKPWKVWALSDIELITIAEANQRHMEKLNNAHIN